MKIVKPIREIGTMKYKAATDKQCRFAKKWGKANGYSGILGGWIYDRNNERVAHGWGQLFWKMNLIQLFRRTTNRTP